MSIARAPSTSLRDKIRRRGYWEFIIRPVSFVEARVSTLDDLALLVARERVRAGGRLYPQINYPGAPNPGIDWVEQGVDREWRIEYWRFYKSGLFYYTLAMYEDYWQNTGLPWPPQESDWRRRSFLDPGEAVATLSAIYEFAARQTQSAAGDASMHLEIKLGNLDCGGRALRSARDQRNFPDEHKALEPRFSRNEDLPQAELIGGTRDLALQAVRDLFRLFAWAPSDGALRRMQEAVGR